MKELKSRLLLLFTLLMFATGWGIWLFIDSSPSIMAIPHYPLMPFLFYAIGIILIFAIFGLKDSSSIKRTNLYLGLKALKLVVFGAVAVYYMFATDVDRKTFAIVYSVFFILYTAFETFTFHKLEKELKKTNNV